MPRRPGGPRRKKKTDSLRREASGFDTACLSPVRPPTLQQHPGGSLPTTPLANGGERSGEKRPPAHPTPLLRALPCWLRSQPSRTHSVIQLPVHLSIHNPSLIKTIYYLETLEVDYSAAEKLQTYEKYKAKGGSYLTKGLANAFNTHHSKMAGTTHHTKGPSWHFRC